MPYFSAALYVMRCILLPLNSFLFFFSPTLRAAAKDVLQCVGESQIMTPLLASIVFFFLVFLSRCVTRTISRRKKKRLAERRCCCSESNSEITNLNTQEEKREREKKRIIISNQFPWPSLPVSYTSTLFHKKEKKRQPVICLR